MDNHPELLYDDLPIGRSFPEMTFAVTDELVNAYIAATGDTNPLYRKEAQSEAGRAVAPPGLWGIWGRRAYLEGARMPPGGVLVGQDMVFEAPVHVGEILTVQANVADRWEKGSRRYVKIESEARTSDGKRCGLVRVTAIWPK